MNIVELATLSRHIHLNIFKERTRTPNYAMQIEPAFRVVEEMHKYGVLMTIAPYVNQCKITVELGDSPYGTTHRFDVCADTTPHAICLAAIKAYEKCILLGIKPKEIQ